jgi:hypothetical protein
MRHPGLAPLATLALFAVPRAATAEPTPGFRIVEDAALGSGLPPGLPDHPLLGDGRGVAAAIEACTRAPAAPTGAALFWLEIGKGGKVSRSKVHGAGKLDACLARALEKAAVADPLTGPIILVGHVDLQAHDSSKWLPSPRVSTTPVVLDAHGSAWQLSANRTGYTDNRALDIAQSLDGASTALAACAPKRGKAAVAAQALAWMDGAATVRSGTPAYDACLARALGAIKLPTPESTFWVQLAITPPGEPLAARSDKPALGHSQAMQDALTTTVRARKAELLTCLDPHPKATVTAVTAVLAAGKVTLSRIATGDTEVAACVRKTFGAVAIPSASPTEHVVLEVTLEPE